ncbi:MAG: serine/threonine protein kinase [Deltaproteobacteria bacterium]|nr:serine/threonine protein kinase [Deltaproteobacteria bacterium]
MARLKSLGKYHMIKRIAIGGMSEIYLASQGGLHGFERAVIVKCIREDLDTEPEVKEMFLDEARIAACLKHPNIVHLYDVGKDSGTAYLAMEYIFGRDLMQISDRARVLGWELPIQFVLKVICDTLAGLHYAHEVAEYEDRKLTVIHRDISPQNIMVSFDGVTKVMDFGIAKAEARLSRTQAGILKGKYAYMSPEQVRGKQLDHRTDQFSLAIVSYEILTGTRLFQRDTDYSTMEAVDGCEIPPIRVLRKDVPRRLVRALRKATKRNPRRRFDSTKDMERYLHKLLKGSSVEQTIYIADYMRKLFSAELDARERAIDEAGTEDREILLSTGFEMVTDQTDRRRRAPQAPSAHGRYQQILAERQSKKTRAKSSPFTEEKIEFETDEQTTERGRTVHDAAYQGRRTQVSFETDARIRGRGQRQTFQDHEITETQTESRGGLLNDWRVVLAIFVLVMLGMLFLIDSLLDSEPEIPPPPISGPSTVARPGVDGFLSVSVRAGVQVWLDGKKVGSGAFRKQPVLAGSHRVILKDPESGRKENFSVNVKVDEEELLVPQGWQ